MLQNMETDSNLKDEELPWQMLDPDPFEDSSSSDSVDDTGVDISSLNTAPDYVTIEQIEVIFSL